MKRAISMLLAAVLMLALPVTSFAAAPAMPEVSIAVNNIKNETMEVAIKVGTGNFKAVGAVLQYDAAKLQPIRWSTTAAIQVKKDPATAAEGWSQATVIESLCPDNLSGKPALAYQSGTTGYLYLGAEAAVAQELQAPTQVVTVRFAYLGAASDTRFTDAAATVKFAANDQVCFASPVKGSMLYQTEDRTSGEYKFYYLNPLTETNGAVGADPSVPEGDRIITEPDVTETPEGETANKGEANTEDFVTVAFYDWDNTLLGTRIVARGGNLIDPNTTSNRALYVNADGTAKYTDAQLQEKGVAPLAPQGNTLTGAADKNGIVMEAKNKEGYRFAGWLSYADGTSSTPVVPLSTTAGVTIDRARLISLEGLEDSYVLKAAYDEEGIGSGAAARRYKATYSPFVTGNGGLQTTFTVMRSAETRRGENGEMYLSLDLRPNGRGLTRLRIPLGKTDVETFTLTMPAEAKKNYQAVTAISFSVVDKNGTPYFLPVNIDKDEIVNHK